MTTLFVNDLTVIDFSYFHEERGLIGESWILDIELTGELNEIGFIFDFGKVKKTIKQTVDQVVDHKCVVAKNSSTIQIEEHNHDIIIEYHSPDHTFVILKSPKSAITILESTQVDMGEIKRFLENMLIKILPKNITHINISLREEEISGPYYHYSHGLKKHDGNCQRIAHGHRSKIAIKNNEKNLKELEEIWANKLKDSYVGTQEDLKHSYEKNEIRYHHFEYESDQGHFEIDLPEAKCIIINDESSVENIAKYISEECQRMVDIRPIKVYAYEGVGKGAISEIEK